MVRAHVAIRVRRQATAPALGGSDSRIRCERRRHGNRCQHFLHRLKAIEFFRAAVRDTWIAGQTNFVLPLAPLRNLAKRSKIAILRDWPHQTHDVRLRARDSALILLFWLLRHGRPAGVRTKREQRERDTCEANGKTDYGSQIKEGGLGSGFSFHGNGSSAALRANKILEPVHIISLCGKTPP